MVQNKVHVPISKRGAKIFNEIAYHWMGRRNLRSWEGLGDHRGRCQPAGLGRCGHQDLVVAQAQAEEERGLVRPDRHRLSLSDRRGCSVRGQQRVEVGGLGGQQLGQRLAVRRALRVPVATAGSPLRTCSVTISPSAIV